MSVLIGHASIDENGNASGGAAGDQTGKEVCTRTWYNKPWDFIAIHPNADVREKHASAVENACANNNVGYDQGQRNTLNTYAKEVDYDLSKITTKCECDCSSLQNVCAIASGAVDEDSYDSNGWTTSNMLSKLVSAGYMIIAKNTSITGYSKLTATQKKNVKVGSAYLISSSYCVRGAIYVKIGSHTVCGLTNGNSYNSSLNLVGISTSSKISTTSTNTTNTTTSTSSTTTATKTTTSSTSSITKKEATEKARSSSSSYNHSYKVNTTSSGLKLRNGAGTSKNNYGSDKSVLVTLPKGTVVRCYGYYTKVGTTTWLYVQVTYNNVTYIGFMSKTYLKQV